MKIYCRFLPHFLFATAVVLAGATSLLAIAADADSDAPKEAAAEGTAKVEPLPEDYSCLFCHADPQQFTDEQQQPRVIRTEGFEAIAIQHELDHLDGYLFLDRVSSLKTDLFRRKQK